MMDISERELLARHIYDELIVSVLRVLSRLDLSVTRDSTDMQVVTDTQTDRRTHTSLLTRHI